MDTSDLAKRMKKYEEVSKHVLMKRTPVAIRIDGKSFHTFTKGMEKPFDDILIKSMQETMKYLCENIQGCVLGYSQSDEITLILIDYQKLDTSAWFDNEIQKICSISASMATMAFNKAFTKKVDAWGRSMFPDWDDGGTYNELDEDAIKLNNAYQKAIEKGASFDARCFNIPKEEVTNLIYLRQLDAIRNSIQAVGQANFSHKELQNKSCVEIQAMLLMEKDINFNNLPPVYKHGSCCIKNYYTFNEYDMDFNYNQSVKKEWIIDNQIPIFKNEGRQYIETLVDI